MFRKEKDSMGIINVPIDAYYGSQTQRAIENFPISGKRLPNIFIKAQIIIKKAAAKTNIILGKLDKKIGETIIKACEELLDEVETLSKKDILQTQNNIFKNKLLNNFKVDIYQAGAGTSQNMNANEVLANRALEILNKEKGNYEIIHPNDHVNMGQSTNDTIHTAIHISSLELSNNLISELLELKKALLAKSKEFKFIFKTGRTHLQDAVPMTLGQEFQGYYGIIDSNISRIKSNFEALNTLCIGGTAIGTRINSNKNYTKIVIEEINKITKGNFKSAKNVFEAMQNTETIVALSGAIKTLAISLNKIANDFRLLSSGPNGGIAEITLPNLQPGSSIMPGKINPVIPEMMNMICYQVIGNDLTICEATQAGQLELNVMMPVIAYNILNSLEILTHGINVFRKKCVLGIKANKAKCQEYLEKNPVIATALTPYLGYNKVAEIIKMAYEKNESIINIILKLKLIDKKELNKILDFKKLTNLNQNL